MLGVIGEIGVEVMVEEVDTIILPGDLLPRVLVVQLSHLITLRLTHNSLLSVNAPVVFADNDTVLTDPNSDEVIV